MSRRILVATLLIFLFDCRAHAQSACSSAAHAGKLEYFNDAFRVCNGSAWTEIDSGPTANTCTATAAADTGKITYSAGDLVYCNGYNWRTTKGVSNGSCAGTQAGTYIYASGNYKYCNGTDNTWYKMVQVPPAAGTFGYFVRVNAHDGNFGGLAGADADCLSQLQVANSWNGYTDANSRGLLIAAKVKAFLCTSTTCNNLQPSTTYKVASKSSNLYGGSWFTTTAAGVGPNDNASWSVYSYMGTATSTWMGNRNTTSNTLWSSGTAALTSCSDWTSNSAAVDGQTGNTAKTSSSRWNNSNTDPCSSTNRYICFVNP